MHGHSGGRGSEYRRTGSSYRMDGHSGGRSSEYVSTEVPIERMGTAVEGVLSR
jgi:hypothetical protein